MLGLPNKKIRVLEVIGNAIVGGMESWVEQLVTRLPADRFQVDALCPFESPFTDRLRATGIDVTIVPMPESPLWDSIQTAITLVKTQRIDLLHAHLPNAHVLAGLVGRLTGCPVLTTIHGRQMTTLDLEVHRTCSTHVSVVCRHSHFHALALGAAPELLSCETNGVDTDRFRPAPQRSRVLRDALRLDDAVPLVGFVGRLSPEKGPEVFVRAAMLLKGLHPQARCVLIGEGPMEAGLGQLVKQLRLSGHVHFAGLARDMPAVYQDLDLAVSSSHSEAMPLAVMEAMSSGLPVVATRVGGVPEIVLHGQTGWLVGSGDFEDIAGRAADLLADPAARAAMGRQARTHALARLGTEASAARVEQLMTRIVATPFVEPLGYVATTMPTAAVDDTAVLHRPRALQNVTARSQTQ